MGLSDLKLLNLLTSAYLDIKLSQLTFNMSATFNDIWNKFDKNGDGEIQKSEIKGFVDTNYSSMSEKQREDIVNNILKDGDANHDDKITKEELKVFLKASGINVD